LSGRRGDEGGVPGETLRRGIFSSRFTRGAPLAVIMVVVLLAAYQVLPVLKVIVVAMLVALVLRTIVNALEDLGAPPLVSVFILILIIAGLGALVVLLVIPSLVSEVQTLISSRGPGTLNSLEKLLNNLPFSFNTSRLLERLQSSLSDIVGSVPSLISTATSLVVAVIGTAFLSIYFAISPRTYVSGVLRIVPREHRREVEAFIYRVGDRLRGWVVGTVIIASFIGVGGGVGLWILGVPLALTFGILAGLLDIIPFFGSILGGLLPALLALTISPVKAIEVVVLFFILNQIEGNLLQPRVMGQQIKLPEGVILVSFLVMGTLVGPVVGTLIAVPTAVLVGVILDELTDPVEESGGGKETGEAVKPSSGEGS